MTTDRDLILIKVIVIIMSLAHNQTGPKSLYGNLASLRQQRHLNRLVIKISQPWLQHNVQARETWNSTFSPPLPTVTHNYKRLARSLNLRQIRGIYKPGHAHWHWHKQEIPRSCQGSYNTDTAHCRSSQAKSNKHITTDTRASILPGEQSVFLQDK